jgi:putative DNA primase/helicase
MSDDPFAPLSPKAPKPTQVKAPPKGKIVLPVPVNAPPAPIRHPTMGEPTARWVYHDFQGAVLGYACRFDPAEGQKQFRPLTLWKSPLGDFQWHWESWPEKRPLYGLQRLAEAPNATAVVCEGEKAAEACAALLPGFVAVTSPNGSKSAAKADWSPLKGRRVVLWPDADQAGARYAVKAGTLCLKTGATSVLIAPPPGGVPNGWDAADAKDDGWTPDRARALIASAVTIAKFNEALPKAPEPTDAPDEGSTGARKRTPQRDLLIALTDAVELWHDESRAAYATFPVNSHREHWHVRSRDFRMWLSSRFYQETGTAIGGQALEDGIRILEARAVNEGPTYECFTRTGQANGNMYLDLGDAHWRAVEITRTRWGVVEQPPIKFLRSASTRALPRPEAGGMIEELRQFVPVKSDDDFMLVVAWIIAAMRHRGPFPILVVNGEAGAGKSMFTRLIRSLVDPSAAPIRAVPRDERDIVVSASNTWILAFDNLSAVLAWLADALCRIATGSGFATRMLHTDRDEMLFDAARPIIINGIPSLTDRADLADRSVTIHLRAIPDAERRPEDELIAEFEAARPRIIGALLDAVVRAHSNVAKVKLERSPRMADFVKWVTAAESGLGWDAGEFMMAYSDNRRDVSEAAFEADAVAVAIWNMLRTKPEGFEGTPTELLEEINNYATEATRRSKYWPQAAAQLGNRLARATPLLIAKGCIVERRHSGERKVIIVPPKHEGGRG